MQVTWTTLYIYVIYVSNERSELFNCWHHSIKHLLSSFVCWMQTIISDRFISFLFFDVHYMSESTFVHHISISLLISQKLNNKYEFNIYYCHIIFFSNISISLLFMKNLTLCILQSILFKTNIVIKVMTPFIA